VFLADRPACSMIGSWHHILSVTLCIVVLKSWCTVVLLAVNFMLTF